MRLAGFGAVVVLEEVGRLLGRLTRAIVELDEDREMI